MGALPINENKKFKYSIYFQSFDEESLEAGSSLESGYEKIESVDTIGDILYLANSVYGIYYPVSFGVWESTEPLTDKDYFEKGIKKYFSLHIQNEDGTDISDEENEFVTFLLSDGRYNSSAFEQYAVGGIVLGTIAVGIGALITYFYFKNKKPSNPKEYSNPRAKSVVRTINGKDRKFPIKDAWKNEHNLENKRERYEVPQADRYEMGGDASQHYHEIEYGEGGVARAKDIIVNKIGWNQDVADLFVDKSEKFAIWMADSILKDALQIQETNKKEYLEGRFNNRYSINAQYGNQIRLILDWLQHPLTPKQDLRNLSWNDANQKALDWHTELTVLGGDIDFVESEKNTILKTYPKNTEGVEYYWVYIPSNFCELESSRMGHCGRTGLGNNLISLRSVKPYGKGHTLSDSHVTIAYGSDGLFEQVKGKKNQKPSQKYHPYIFDLIKNAVQNNIEFEKVSNKFDANFKLITEKLPLEFTGFGSEYGDSEDYGFEDMTKEELSELFELKPSLFENAESMFFLLDKGIFTIDDLKKNYDYYPDLFKGFLNQVKLHNAGIINERPSTSFKIDYACSEVSELLTTDYYISIDIVERVLCGDSSDLYDNWSYYYENASDSVGNLNKEITERFIDEIVRITGLERSEVIENGISYYLENEDDSYDFDNLKRVLASAQNNADADDYYKYLYDAIKNALEELGTVYSLNDEGVKMNIDISQFLTDEQISENLKYYDVEDMYSLFEELKGNDIELPKVIIDERYSPYGSSEDFNDYISDSNLEEGYEKGGNIHAKNTSTKNKNKTMKPIKTEFANGGNLGVSKQEYFDVVSNWVYFTFNYPMGFVKSAFNSTHLEEKFSSAYTRYGSIGVCMSFWANLDGENRRILSLWIKNNYVNKKDSNIQSISDDDYTNIITHWNLFCFNYPQGFVERAFANDNLLVEHFEQKFTRAYESAGSVGAVNKFFTELSENNQRTLTDWVFDNYKGNQYNEGGTVKRKRRKKTQPKVTRIQFEEGNYEYAGGGNVDERIKDWYIENYPTDELGVEMYDDASFDDLWKGILNGEDVYEIMGVGDSIVRERLFEHLAELHGVEYGHIYDIWLESDKYAGGGEVSVYNLRKGDKIKTRTGNIETIERKIESGYFTQESAYSQPFESIEFIERPTRRMSKGGGLGQKEVKIRDWSELKPKIEKIQEKVNKMSAKEVADTWNKNHFLGTKNPNKWTSKESGSDYNRRYLAMLLFEKELSEAEQEVYFAKGGGVDGVRKLTKAEKKKFYSEGLKYFGFKEGDLIEYEFLGDSNDEFNEDEYGRELLVNVTNKPLGKDAQINPFSGRRIEYDSFSNGGGVDDHIYFAVVKKKGDENYDKIGYSKSSEFIEDKQGNKFDKLYFGNKKTPTKYNAEDINYSVIELDEFTSTSGRKFILLKENTEDGRRYYYILKYDDKSVYTESYDMNFIKSELKRLTNGKNFYSKAGVNFDEGGEAREFKYLYVKQVPNGLKLELTDEGINGYKDEEIYEMYDLFEDVQANSEMTYIDNAGDMGFGLTEAPIITDGYFYDDNGDLTDDGNTDSKVYVWNDYMLKDLFFTLMEQGSVVLTEVKSEGGEADDDDDDDDDNDDDYAGGGGVDNKIKIKGFPPISKEEALLMQEDFEQNFSSNIEKYTKHLNRVHNSKLRVIDVKEVIDFANTYAGGGQIKLYDVVAYNKATDYDNKINGQIIADSYTRKVDAIKTMQKFKNTYPYIEIKEYMGNDPFEYAEGGEVLEWMYDALDSLIAETGFTDLEITIVADNGNEFYAEGNGTEYRVFKTEDDAQVQAEEQVLDDLKENPEYFNRNWLMNYIDGRAYFETVLNEMNYNYVEDLKSDTGGNYENDLIEQLVINGLMDEDDARSSQAEELAEERIDDLVNLLTENQLDEGNDGLDYLIDNFGEEEAFEMIVENNLIDTDSATKNAVYIDGIAHFLSSYDGETLYLPNEYVAYRVN